MRNRIIITVLVFLCICCSAFIIIQHNYTSNLEHQLIENQRIRKETIKKDSAYSEKTKQYAQELKQYVNECEFQIGNKTISAVEMISLANKNIRENAMLKDSMSVYRGYVDFYKQHYLETFDKNRRNSDSLAYNQALLIYIKKRYDLDIGYERTEHGIKLTGIGINKIDSALAIWPYYRDRVRLDSSGKSWIITLPKKGE
jgi:hypothetical protein